MAAGRSLRSWWLVVGTIVIALAQPVVMTAWSGTAASLSAEDQLIHLTNQARAIAGLPSLPADTALAAEARARSRDMVERGYFSHQIPPDGHRAFDELAAGGGCFRAIAENIGWNATNDGRATQEIMDAFMASPAHRAAILGSGWTSIGTGAYQGDASAKMWTILFGVDCRTAADTAAAGTTAADTLTAGAVAISH